MTDTMGASVSITGMGVISAIGNNSQAVLASLRAGKTGIGKMEYLSSVHDGLPVGEVKLSSNEMKELLGIPKEKVVSRTSMMGAIAIREALCQAGVKDCSGKKVILISGTTVGTMDVTEQQFLSSNDFSWADITTDGNECGRSTQQMAELAGLDCASCCTICTACSSALNAIILGKRMLERDDADIVIAGGSEALSRFHLNGFNTLMILDKELCRPFCATRAGLNLGEGAGFVVLEKNAVHPLAYVNGCANRCDAFHQTATSQTGDGAYMAMSAAIKMAGIQPSDIGYINAHGTGTPDNDASESAAFVRVFGSDVPPFSSTKSYTGHTTSASGGIETVICLLAMINDFIPASIGWKEKIQDGLIPSAGETCIRIDNVMCNSFGFGGNDSSLIIGREPSASATVSCKNTTPLKIISKSTVCRDEQLPELKNYLSPLETRRMGKLMRAALLSAFTALKEAGLKAPGAIITTTSKGMLELSSQFLHDIAHNGEELLKPTLFMQSTHNTIGSAIAIRTGCHGYNITYSQGEESLRWALLDAGYLLSDGEAGTVLVCSFDETVADCKTTAFHVESSVYAI